MNRRNFLGTLATLPAGMAVPALAQEGPPVVEPVEKETARRTPTIALNHMGFRPRSGRKVLVVRATVSPPPSHYTLRDIGSEPFHFTRPLKLSPSSDLGPCLTADFTDLERLGMYQITVGEEHSVPFFIREDAWRRTLPTVVGYYRWQRCGVAVPGVHPVCHLDDARRRDNGEHVDEVGGWHDAGDLRKWMDPTLLNAIALLNLDRNLAARQPGDPSTEQILEEVRHGNLYFLKMQDTDGRVWHDTAGGINGDNSDNHWTDNIIGTPDDRYINTKKLEHISAMFSTLQGLVSQAYRAPDPAYAARCLAAGERAWQANARTGATLDLAWWALADCELHRATGKTAYRHDALRLGKQLLARQNVAFAAGQKEVRGYWTESPSASTAPSSSHFVPYFNVVYPALPAMALLNLYETFPTAADAPKWKAAVRRHLDEYVLPMSERNAFRLIPSGLYLGQPTPETYRPLAGELTYRYFMPVRKQFWWQGINSHLGSYALLLGEFARVLNGENGSGTVYADLAYRQLEWIMGANPFGACLMTAQGMRNPFPHSRFVGLIPGGIMNGIAGNEKDEPILDQEFLIDWRTCEYWSPHVAYYLWSVSTLESSV